MTTTVKAPIVAPAIGRPSEDTTPRRCVDVAVSAVGLIGAAPLLVVLGTLVRATSRGPALFAQSRVGCGERLFTIWKLRTMNVCPEGVGSLVSGTADPRVTRIGSWLRRTRLDELPQLINLLRGDLTLIGPRPEVPRFIAHYTPIERQLLGVRPGIIGPGAVLFASGQSRELNASIDPDAFYVAHHLHPRLDLDRDYLAHRTLRRDLALLGRALRVCVRHV